jgi:signal peptidase II
MARSRSTSAVLFWSIAAAVVALDVVTKYLAVVNLPPRVPHFVLGQEWLRLTLVHNRGAAFGLHLGHDVVTRFVFIGLTLIALVILWRLYRQSDPAHTLRVIALAAVCGGALGNLFDRLRSAHGVVDFLDIGMGSARWPTFNVADMAVSTGAVALAMVLWREEKRGASVSLADTPPRESLTGSGERTVL